MSALWDHTCEDGTLFLDHKTAFPSLSHEWLFEALEASAAPLPLRRAARAMYTRGAAEIALPGAVPVRFPATSGVRQGCPRSATLFVLALEPWHVMVRWGSPAPGCLWGAYASDVALALRRLVACLASAQTVLRLLRLARALALESVDEVRAAVSWVAPGFSVVQIVGCARYLGAMLGPVARPEFSRRCREVLGPLVRLMYRAHRSGRQSPANCGERLPRVAILGAVSALEQIPAWPGEPVVMRTHSA